MYYIYEFRDYATTSSDYNEKQNVSESQTLHSISYQQNQH